MQTKQTRGARIREAKKHWLSQSPDRTVASLIKLLGVTVPTYYNWEGDKVDDILFSNLMKFAKITGFHPDYLNTGKGPKLLAEDASLSELMGVIEDFSTTERKDLLKYASMIRSARPKQAGNES